MKSILKDPILKKGTVIGWDWWFVVVEVTFTGQIRCICDNANNIYSYNIKELVATEPNEWVIIQPEEFNEVQYLFAQLGKEYSSLIEREFPWEVVAEVLIGRHDHRFTRERSEVMN